MSNINRKTQAAKKALRRDNSNTFGFPRAKIEYESKFDRIKRRLLARKRGSLATAPR